MLEGRQPSVGTASGSTSQRTFALTGLPSTHYALTLQVGLNVHLPPNIFIGNTAFNTLDNRLQNGALRSNSHII